ncbi:hypothetical protein [Aquabacterium sp. CECT 9606]|uniref:hypothetical protein n=1 Tax=Aquabacterium sp. CECT 9606 TaxID=2845822 RepID=UPI001E538159|nr:hypothetical protein [Aquabacterium sp. CECT 9606]
MAIAQDNGAGQVRGRLATQVKGRVALGNAENVSMPEWASISPVPGACGTHAVDDPEIAEVLDKETGEFVGHQELIGDEYERAIQLRLVVGLGRLTRV